MKFWNMVLAIWLGSLLTVCTVVLILALSGKGR